MEIDINPSRRVVLIGAGNVGASIAYSILTQEIAKEILIIDIAEELARAQVLDMQDSSNFTHGIKVKYANYSDVKDGDIIVVTAGAPQKEGQTRLDLLEVNVKIARNIISEIKATGKIVYLLIIANPVDVLTYLAVQESGLPRGLVFGSGTVLDSARLKVAIAQELDVSSSNVHAYILGEHGDSSFPVLSSSNVAGIPLKKMVNLDESYYSSIANKVRDRAYEIIKGKKATYYGIGSAVARICKSILNNERNVLPLSVVLEGEYGYSDVAIGVPAMIGSHGVKILGEISMDENERKLFDESVQVIKDSISQI